MKCIYICSIWCVFVVRYTEKFAQIYQGMFYEIKQYQSNLIPHKPFVLLFITQTIPTTSYPYTFYLFYVAFSEMLFFNYLSHKQNHLIERS